VTSIVAPAKINLALLVGPVREDGLHELATVYERIDLHDTLELERGEPGEASVEGFAADTLVRRALLELAAAAGVEPAWRVRVEKRIPVAAGLGGGSSDAAAALRLANATLGVPLAAPALHELARSLGADVPFFLSEGPQLGTGGGSDLAPLDLRRDYAVVLLLPCGARKASTGAVYARFDREQGFAERRARLLAALARGELAELPPNDLASSPLAARLRALGAFRADVSGAGPTVYGLFADRAAAERAAAAVAGLGRTWLAGPAC
jgi:4-diphosphocytidyl-2-C-methyl-D-erythritol kinase